MIHTRDTIYASVKSSIKDLQMLAKYNPTDFKKIMYAIILNDLKEWQEYIPDYKHKRMQEILEKYLVKSCNFKVTHFIPKEEELVYRNVNTPQNNNTWSRVWDKKSYKEIDTVEHIYPPVEGVVDMSRCAVVDNGIISFTNCE